MLAPPKKRVWGSRLPFRYRIRKSASQVSGTHREIGPIGTKSALGITYYPHYDQVGSLRVIIDTTGTVIKQIDYDSFGNVTYDSNTTMTVPFGFAGGFYDYDVGLVRFGFRDYDPAIGRWTAKDPIDFAGGDVNLYGYAYSDPINFVDPLGLEPPPYPYRPGETYPAHNPFDNITGSNVQRAERILNVLTFEDLVEPGGPWDFKQGGPEWEDFGNYNYGACGAATALFSLETLLREAGRVHSDPETAVGTPQGGPPYGDDPKDQYWIIQGYNDYMNGMYGTPNMPHPLVGVPVQFWGNIFSRRR